VEKFYFELVVRLVSPLNVRKPREITFFNSPLVNVNVKAARCSAAGMKLFERNHHLHDESKRDFARLRLADAVLPME
jgi:hypothetical protein